MPWFPEFASAAELAREQTRAAGHADPVRQYLAALNGTDPRALETAWPGEVVVYDLQAGNTLRVHPGHVGMYQESVQFNITTVPGIKNAFFGGDGIFLAALTGPGRVWLQSMTMQHLAHAIQEYLPKAG